MLMETNLQKSNRKSILYRQVMDQSVTAKFMTGVAIYIPSRRIVGTTVTGPMNLRSTPIRPVPPISAWMAPTNIKVPCICI